uniref:SET domain-containing protein n=1 Tax=Coccolithus braarudii TaxID=221442 RepID=A0A7S0LDV9_9EUKA|mmetsp:Transcript_35186/g.75133  ORF Transcript_35186/g.75133 Transcript_35186/m.75133 type:complete len:212 (+) Transcript_35186:176-811(+)
MIRTTVFVTMIRPCFSVHTQLRSILLAAFSLVVSVVIAVGVRATTRRKGLLAAPRRWWAHGIEVRQSLIPNSGDGLFATRGFAAGETIGEYYGQVLTLLQAHRLEHRDYLMGGFGINAHVDARFAMDAPARYINDHFDQTKLNARFEKLKPKRRALAVATRDIRAGEEIYASYGETYWRARGIDPSTGKALPASGENGPSSTACAASHLRT